MSNAEVVKPAPAGTKEEADFVPSVNLHSVRDMFENPKESDSKSSTADVGDESGDLADRDPDVVRSTAAGTREEVAYESSIDLKSARSRFENKPEIYVPRNRIKEREEERKRERDAAAAAMATREGEPGDSVIRTVDVDSKEVPDYHVDLKEKKQMFEGGKVPTPVKKEMKTRQHVEVKGDVVRPEPAGTKQVVDIPVSTDIKSVKMRFENPKDEQEETEIRRKAPIDIHEEARMVMQKEMEVKEEVQKSCNSDEELPRDVAKESKKTDEGVEAVLGLVDDPHDDALSGDDGAVSVSSEELVEKGVEEYEDAIEIEASEEEETETHRSDAEREEMESNIEQDGHEASEVDTEKKEEPESEQDGESQEEADNCRTEVYHSSAMTVMIKGGQVISDDDLKQNVYNENNQNGYSENGNSSYEIANNAVPADKPKGITINLDNSQQQFSLHSSTPAQAEYAPGEENDGYPQ